ESASERVHVSVARFAVQPDPPIAVALNPAGRASVTVTVPAEAPVPTLVTMTVNVSPTSPWENVAEWLTTTVRSGLDCRDDALWELTAPREKAATLLSVSVSPPLARKIDIVAEGEAAWPEPS